MRVMDLLITPDEVSARSTDFGRIVTRTPRGVMVPYSTDDVVISIERARAGALSVSTRGGGHSQSGQSLVDGGLVLDTTSMSRVLAIDPAAGTVTCQAGILWRDLL